MDAREYIDYLNNRFKTYGKLKLMFKDIKSQSEFRNLVCEVFDEIFQDQEDFNDWVRVNQPLAPVEKKYMELANYSNSVLTFLNNYKNLRYDMLYKTNSFEEETEM